MLKQHPGQSFPNLQNRKHKFPLCLFSLLFASTSSPHASINHQLHQFSSLTVSWIYQFPSTSSPLIQILFICCRIVTVAFYLVSLHLVLWQLHLFYTLMLLYSQNSSLTPHWQQKNIFSEVTLDGSLMVWLTSFFRLLVCHFQYELYNIPPICTALLPLCFQTCFLVCVCVCVCGCLEYISFSWWIPTYTLKAN